MSVRHAIVGERVNVPLDPGDPERVTHREIRKCDVLVSDCEGAELEIIKAIEHHPETIIVETHGIHGSPTGDINFLVEGGGYRIERPGRKIKLRVCMLSRHR